MQKEHWRRRPTPGRLLAAKGREMGNEPREDAVRGAGSGPVLGCALGTAGSNITLRQSFIHLPQRCNGETLSPRQSQSALLAPWPTRLLRKSRLIVLSSYRECGAKECMGGRESERGRLPGGGPPLVPIGLNRYWAICDADPLNPALDPGHLASLYHASRCAICSQQP